jgi:hypothetical protein
MGTVLNPSGPVIAAISNSTKVIEGVIVAAVIILLVVTIVLYRRKNAPAKPASANSASANQYYGDVATLANSQPVPGGTQGIAGRPGNDPFAGFASPEPAPVPAGSVAPPSWSAPAPSPATPGPAVPATPGPTEPSPPPPPPNPAHAVPPAGTPAGWLPETSGVPDTLRYWDGSAWTQHVAQRS